MAVNLTALVSQFLTPDLITKIAQALGLDPSVTRKALEGAAPGLLGGLVGVASTRDGANRLFHTVTSQRPGMLEELTMALGGPSKEALIQNGSTVLSSLLGGSAASALAGAVGKYAGIGQGAGSSLLGLLTPVVMGVLGNQRAASNLDASGLAHLLASQKSNISIALPTGMGDALSGAGVSGFSGATVLDAPDSWTTQSNAAGSTSARRSGLAARVAWVIPLIIVAAGAWWFLSRGIGPTDRATNSANQTVQNPPVGEVDAASTLQSTLEGLKTNLQGVTDVVSAQAALPKLQDATAQLDKLGGLSTQLPAAARTALAARVTAERPSIEELLNKVLALPGVAAIAKPAIDQFRSKFDALPTA